MWTEPKITVPQVKKYKTNKRTECHKQAYAVHTKMYLNLGWKILVGNHKALPFIRTDEWPSESAIFFPCSSLALFYFPYTAQHISKLFWILEPLIRRDFQIS